LLDLRGVPPGNEVVLRSLDFDPMRDALAALCRTSPASVAGAPAAREAAAPADGAALDLLRIRVHAGPAYDGRIPSRISDVPALAARKPRVRDFLLDHARMRWTINGARFEMLRTQLSVERGAVEIWQFRNPPGGMPHPVHMHGFPFRMLERRGS